MPKLPTPDRIALTGADCFLRAFDFEVRRHAGASHSSQLVLRLGPGFDAAAFAKLLAEVAAAQPILRAPIRRPWGSCLPSIDQLARNAALPGVEIHDAPRAAVASHGEPELPPLRRA
jgi:hypothetical protein